MKDRKLFDFGLYREGIKQLRMPGIVFFVIFSFMSAIVFVSEVLDNRARFVKTVMGMQMLPVLVGLTIVAFILTLYLFRFLNNRNTSDFYHAMPYSRECVFISFFTSILTWIVFIGLGTSLLSLALYSIFSNSFTVIFQSWLMYTLNCIVASFLVAACTAFAATITGTAVNTVIVSVLIMFLPRFFITLMTYVLEHLLPMMTNTHIGFLLENKYNLLSYMLFDGFDIFNWFNDVIYDADACIYTAVLALIYAVIACLLFKKRKSETAGQSAPNRIMQAVYRITLTMVVCFIALSAIFWNYGKIRTSDMFIIVIFFVAAVLIYFLYELITTKKWKNLIKAAPALGIVVLLNVLVYLGMLGIYNIQLNFTPTAAEISSVSLVAEGSGYYDLEGYYRYLSSDIELEDEDVKRIVAENLKGNIDAFKVSKSNYNSIYGYGARNYSENLYDFQSGMTGKTNNNLNIRVCIKIKTSFGTHYRRIVIPSEEFKVIENALFQSEEYKKCVLTLPEPLKKTVSFGYIKKFNDHKEALEIFRIMQEELANIDSSVWLKQIKRSDELLKINYYTFIDNKQIYISVPINPKLMPKTYEKFMEVNYEKGATDRNEIVKNLKAGNYLNKSCTLILMLKQPDGTFEQFSSTIQSSNYKAISYLLDHTVDEKITADDSYVYIEISEGTYGVIYDDVKYGNDVYIGYFNLGNLTYEDLKNAGFGDVFSKYGEYPKGTILPS